MKLIKNSGIKKAISKASPEGGRPAALVGGDGPTN